MTFLPVQISTFWVFAASILFLAKHFIADFLLQTNWMALGKSREQGWIFPLSVHAGIHALATAGIFLIASPQYAWLGLVDFIVHFGIDRGKTLVSQRLEPDPSQSVFWWLIGLDQTLHHLTNLGFVLVIAIAHTA